MLAIAVLIFEPVTAENGLLSSWSMSSVVSKSIILPLLDFQRVLRRISLVRFHMKPETPNASHATPHFWHEM